MAVVLYTVQSRTWTNRMNVEAKFILSGLVKMQHVLEHHFAACSQRLKSPLNVTMSVQFASMVGQRQIFLPPIPKDVCFLMSSSKFKNPTFVLEPSQLQQNTAAIFLRTIWNAVSSSEKFSLVKCFWQSVTTVQIWWKLYSCGMTEWSSWEAADYIRGWQTIR